MVPCVFVHTIRPDAEICSAETLLPLAPLLAVPALETGWGRGLLQGGVYTYNLFNIKGTGPAGQVAIDTVEWLTWAEWQRLKERGVRYQLTGRLLSGRLEGNVTQLFRVYRSFQESYQDFYSVIRSHPRYSALLHTQDAFDFCTALQDSGFATDPNYAEKLHQILRKRVIPALEQPLGSECAGVII